MLIILLTGFAVSDWKWVWKYWRILWAKRKGLCKMGCKYGYWTWSRCTMGYVQANWCSWKHCTFFTLFTIHSQITRGNFDPFTCVVDGSILLSFMSIGKGQTGWKSMKLITFVIIFDTLVIYTKVNNFGQKMHWVYPHNQYKIDPSLMEPNCLDQPPLFEQQHNLTIWFCMDMVF